MVFSDIRRKIGRSLDNQAHSQAHSHHFVEKPLGSWGAPVPPPRRLTQTSFRGCSGYGHCLLGLCHTHSLLRCDTHCPTLGQGTTPPLLQLCDQSTFLLEFIYAGIFPEPSREKGTERRGNPLLGRVAFPNLCNRGSDTYLFRLRVKEPHGQTSMWGKTQLLRDQHSHASKKWIILFNGVTYANKAIFTKMWRPLFNSIHFSLHKNKSIWSFHLKKYCFSFIYYFCHIVFGWGG